MRPAPAGGCPLQPRTVLLYVIVFCTQCDRTIYVMTVAWLAIGETGNVSAAGRILLWWPLICLFAGPAIGVIVDRYNRRNVLILGELLRVAGVAWLILSPHMTMPTLHAVSVIAYFGALLSILSTQALLQAVGAHALTRVVMGSILGGLAAEILGAIVAGFLIATCGVLAALIVCALLASATAVLAVPLRKEGALPFSSKGDPLSIAAAPGFRALFRDPTLLVASVGYALTWATAQMTVALLPAFTRFDLELGADAYGWIDAMWGMGGVVSGIVLIRWCQEPLERKRLVCTLLLLAMATAGFSAAGGLWTALVLHGLMGAFFTVSVATCETHILKAVDARAIGRVRSNLQAAIGATGVAVFLLPTLQGGSSARVLYLVFSVSLAVAALALLIGAHVAARSTPRRDRRRRTGRARQPSRRRR